MYVHIHIQHTSAPTSYVYVNLPIYISTDVEDRLSSEQSVGTKLGGHGQVLCEVLHRISDIRAPTDENGAEMNRKWRPLWGSSQGRSDVMIAGVVF